MKPIESLLIAFLAVACLPIGQVSAAELRKLNILFIVADDLRPDLGCYGNSAVHSPNIDRLAASGMVFDRAYCQVALCNPSRSSALTGRRPDATQVFDNGARFRQALPDAITLPQLFKQCGYHTQALGKIFHPGCDDVSSWSVPHWESGKSDEDAQGAELVEEMASYYGPEGRALVQGRMRQAVKAGKDLDRLKRRELLGPAWEAPDVADDDLVDGRTAARAVETLRELKDRPFFLAVGFLKPHLPFVAPKRYWDLYPPEKIQYAASAPPKDAPPFALHPWTELRAFMDMPQTGPLSDAQARQMIRGYRAATSYTDAQVGRVLDELARLGLREKTLVVFWGDHGWQLGEHGLWCKHTNFELATRAPLILSMPEMKTAGAHTRALVEFVDIYPTLAELAGLPLPPHLEGTSFAPLLAKPDQPWKKAAFSQYLRPGKDKIMGRSMRTDRWRYTEWLNANNESDGVELYDEATDPNENVNVAGEVPNKALVGQLAKELHAGWSASIPPPASATGDVVLGSFDGKTWEGWSATGDAFDTAPFKPGDSGRFADFEGAGVAWSGHGGVSGKGALLSPEFSIRHKFINYRIAGARDVPAVLGAELIVDGRVVRSGSASEAKDPSHALYWRTWEVRELLGHTARIRVNDQSAAGSVVADQFMQSDQAKGVPADATILGQESHRPQYHYTALTGWLNDANGLLHYKDQWHLFHQHRPADGTGIVWGHATSSDLLHWQRLPIAIASGSEDACASGSGLVDWENASGLKRGEDPPILLFYTLMPPAGGERKGTQCLAYSTDGLRTLTPFPGNPILRTPATRDRDPKVFFHKPTRSWIMVLSLSRNNTDRDRATYGLFRSKDLKSWELLQELGPGAWYWECPDMFELAVDGDPAKTKWVFMKGSGDYMIGSFDGNRFTPEAGPIRTHWGGSFYGGQTFSDAPGGRRVHMAWMSTGKAGPNSWPGMPFNQQMSFPRELTLRTTPEGPRLFREPIAEIAQLYTRTHELKTGALEPGDNALADTYGELLDVELEIELKSAKQLRLNLRGEEIVYDPKDKKLKAFGRALAFEPIDGKFVLRVLLDRTSIELFGNRGDLTFSSAFFPDPANKNLALTVGGGGAQVHRLVVHELGPIWSTKVK